MKVTLLFVMALLVAAVAQADPTGAAQFRVLSNGIFGFAYNASPNEVTGEFWDNGTTTVHLNRDERGSWQGPLGRYYIVTKALKTSRDGKRLTLDIQSNPGGIFSYTIKTDRKGNLEITSFGPRGDLTSASLKSDGSEFSVLGSRVNMGVRSRSDRPGSYEGDVLPLRGGFGETATMTAAGSLDLQTLAKADPALFIALYVLPFEESSWPNFN